jgi:hypothetical protein
MTDIIKLNIGGVKYQTTYDTIRKDDNSMLSSMFSGRHKLLSMDLDGYYFIDRNGEVFKYIIKYLRDGKINFSNMSDDTKNDLLDEAEYYNLTGLINYINDYNRDTVLEHYLFNVYNIDIRDFEYKFNNIFSVKIIKEIGLIIKKYFNEKLNLTFDRDPIYQCYIINTNVEFKELDSLAGYNIKYKSEFENIFNFYLEYENIFNELLKLNNDSSKLFRTPYKNIRCIKEKGSPNDSPIKGCITLNIIKP